MSTRRCQAKLKSKRGGMCNEIGAEPRFTAPLSTATRRHPQPQWFCPEHLSHYPERSSFDGALKQPWTKSYVIVKDKLVPLKGGDQYGKIFP